MIQNGSSADRGQNPTSRLLLGVRKSFDHTQAEMAQRLGITRSAYQHYERGERDTPWEVMRCFFETFRIDPVLAFFENGEEIIDARNLMVMRVYQEANEFVRNRAKALGKSLSYEKERYVSEAVAQELMGLSITVGDLSPQQDQRFETMIRMVA